MSIKWAYFDDEYPEDGSVGPFEGEKKAREHANGYEDPVTFFQLTEAEADLLESSDRNGGG